MSGFTAIMGESAIWELIDFFRAKNPDAAVTVRNHPSWGAPHVHAH